MEVTLDRPIFSGKIEAIQSKSMAHRYLICAALADKETEIACRCYSDDIRATVECLRAMGADIKRNEEGFRVKPIDRKAPAQPEATQSMSLGNQTETRSVEAQLPCGESGSTLRFLLPVVVAQGQKAAFLPQGRLPERPLSPLYEELVCHGAALAPQGSAPFAAGGKLNGGKYSLAGNISSQFVTGLLFALILCEDDSVLELIEPVESKAYIDLTLDSLRAFGIEIPIVRESGKDGQPGKWLFEIKGNQIPRSPGRLMVEADWSNAAFWLCAGALNRGANTSRSAEHLIQAQRSEQGSIAGSAAHSLQVQGLNMKSSQGDKAVIEVLREMGANIVEETDDNGLTSITVSSREEGLHSVEIDASGIPDLVPILALVASTATGTTQIYNAERLRLKESDRLNSVATVLNELGADVKETKDGLIINGSNELRGGMVDSFGDHRIAMMAAVAASVCCEAVTITGAQAVNKSYPEFFEDAERLSVKD